MISIIIPTYNHLEDALKPCLEALFKYTSLDNKEVIVVANGCTDGTVEYLGELIKEKPIKYIWFAGALGYIRAINEGIKLSSGEFIITLDNDSHLLPQEVDEWINILRKPMLLDRNVAITGPFGHEYPDIGRVIHSGCTMYRRKPLFDVKLFDEAFNPGFLGDSDLAIRIQREGYKAVIVPENPIYNENGIFSVHFPVMHLGHIDSMGKRTFNEPKVAANLNLLNIRHKGNKFLSIVIPTYNHLEDCLKPCIESIFKYTDLENAEIVVVANGCTDGTKEYVESLGNPVRLVWFDEALGYTKAANEGMKESRGRYIVLLNNDTELLPQEKNMWVDLLLEPFRNVGTAGISGPLKLYDAYADIDTLIFFCVMISRDVINRIGFLDEIFSPGGGEDIDYCARAGKAGHTIHQVPYEGKLQFTTTNTGEFPIWHKNNMTFRDIEEYGAYIIKTNGLINCKRYNKHIKLNLGSGGVHFPGYLSVDKNDKRTHILMDATNLDFEDNSIEEIIASHLFEHINPYQSVPTLRHWWNKLKPGGKVILEVPNIEELCAKFVTASKQERYGILNCIYGAVNTTAEGNSEDITSSHMWGWYPEMLIDHLTWAGFENIQILPEQIPHPLYNFRVEANKPK